MTTTDAVLIPRGARRLVLKGAKIIFHHQNATIDCRVRNLSDHGACLEIENSVGVPDAFDLAIGGDDQTRSCQVVWRKARRIGVKFG